MIIFGGNGIEFVVVTAGASDGGGLEGFGEGVDLVIDDFITDLRQADAIVVVDFAEAVEGGADDGFVELLLVVPARVIEQVTGDMFTNELVVGKILVEGADQIIAITPGVVHLVIPFVAMGFGKADDIEPMPGPALAEMRRREEAINEALPSVRGSGIDKLPNGLRFGRHPGQDERESADESAFVRGRGEVQSGVLKAFANEIVDGIAGISGEIRWWLNGPERLQAPPLTAFGHGLVPGGCGRQRGGRNVKNNGEGEPDGRGD